METAKDLLVKNVRRVRDARGWTQAELAEQADISVHMVQKIEYGRTNPSLETLDALARALDCHVADFYLPSQTTPISAEDLGRAVLGLIAARPARQAFVLFLATRDPAYLDRLPETDRQSLEALNLA